MTPLVAVHRHGTRTKRNRSSRDSLRGISHSTIRFPRFYLKSPSLRSYLAAIHVCVFPPIIHTPSIHRAAFDFTANRVLWNTIFFFLVSLFLLNNEGTRPCWSFHQMIRLIREIYCREFEMKLSTLLSTPRQTRKFVTTVNARLIDGRGISVQRGFNPTQETSTSSRFPRQTTRERRELRTWKG